MSCACGSSGAAVCGAGGVTAWERGRREGGARAWRVLMSTTRLGQLADLPEHDGRDAPRLEREQLALSSRQLIGESAEEDVGVDGNDPRGHPPLGAGVADAARPGASPG